MSSSTEAAGHTIPKFGAWDVNNPASADGFTVIFNKARDEKKAPTGGDRTPAHKSIYSRDSRTEKMNSYDTTRTNSSKKWLCCVSPSPTEP